MMLMFVCLCSVDVYFRAYCLKMEVKWNLDCSEVSGYSFDWECVLILIVCFFCEIITCLFIDFVQ